MLEAPSQDENDETVSKPFMTQTGLQIVLIRVDKKITFPILKKLLAYFQFVLYFIRKLV